MKRQDTPSTFEIKALCCDETKAIKWFAEARWGKGEYVRGKTHTNGIESFWVILKRGYIGTHHYMSVKHLSCYVDEFVYRYNSDQNAMEFMKKTARAMVGRKLTHNDLVRGE